jgi:hypothetical protein
MLLFIKKAALPINLSFSKGFGFSWSVSGEYPFENTQQIHAGYEQDDQ